MDNLQMLREVDWWTVIMSFLTAALTAHIVTNYQLIKALDAIESMYDYVTKEILRIVADYISNQHKHL